MDTRLESSPTRGLRGAVFSASGAASYSPAMAAAGPSGRRRAAERCALVEGPSTPEVH